MNIAVAILVIVGVLGPAVWALLRRGRSAAVATSDSLASRIQPVDLEAFQNLLDPAESDYLRQRLPAATFRRLQRLRIKAAILYYRRIAGNAAVFLRLGEASRGSADPATAEAGRRLAETAVQVRGTALRAIALLLPVYVWPTAGETPASITEPYAQLRQLASAVGRLQHARSAAAVEAPV